MPTAEILSTQAMHTLQKLHAELAGKLIDNKLEARRLIRSMQQVEAVMKLLQPGYDVRRIAVRRRQPNPWFKKGTVFRTAMDVLRASEGPLTSRQIAECMVKAKGVQNADRQAVIDLAAGIQTSLRNHNGKSVEVIGHAPTRWRLKPQP